MRILCARFIAARTRSASEHLYFYTVCRMCNVHAYVGFIANKTHTHAPARTRSTARVYTHRFNVNECLLITSWRRRRRQSSTQRGAQQRAVDHLNELLACATRRTSYTSRAVLQYIAHHKATDRLPPAASCRTAAGDVASCDDDDDAALALAADRQRSICKCYSDGLFTYVNVNA